MEHRHKAFKKVASRICRSFEKRRKRGEIEENQQDSDDNEYV